MSFNYAENEIDLDSKKYLLQIINYLKVVNINKLSPMFYILQGYGLPSKFYYQNSYYGIITKQINGIICNLYDEKDLIDIKNSHIYALDKLNTLLVECPNPPIEPKFLDIAERLNCFDEYFIKCMANYLVDYYCETCDKIKSLAFGEIMVSFFQKVGDELKNLDKLYFNHQFIKEECGRDQYENQINQLYGGFW